MWSLSLRVLVTFATLFALSVAALADTIRLKDGSIIKGHIVSFVGGNFVVEIGEGARRRELTFAAAEIQSITFDSQSPATTTNRNASYTEPEQKPDIRARRSSRTIRSHRQRRGGKDEADRVECSRHCRQHLERLDEQRLGRQERSTHPHYRRRQDLARARARIPHRQAFRHLRIIKSSLKNVATGALIAVIGDDNNDFIYVGAEREFTATRDGALFLGVNEGYLEDNSGAFNVKIEILPDEGA